MRLIAILGLVLTLGVLALPRHGTPSERSASAERRYTAEAREETRSDGGAGTGLAGVRTLSAAGPGRTAHAKPSNRLLLRSLGVSLAADHNDPPVETITITLPRSKPKHRHVGASRRTHNARWSSPAATIARISRAVFHARWRTAACIAHYESTDGRYLYNGPSLGPWQINTAAHPWANAWRLVHDWPYSARVAYRISRGGRDWAPWTTHWRCGA